jgi:hypothetical protein
VLPRDELGAERERRVNLVHDHERAVRLGHRRDRGQLVARVDAPARVVRRAQQQRAGAGRERAVEPVHVHSEVRPQRHLDHPPTDVRDVFEVRRIGRRVDDHAVAGLRVDGQQLLEADHHVGEQRDVLTLEVPAEPAVVEVVHGLDQAVDVADVAQVTAVDRAMQRFADWRRQGKVHLGHPRRQDVGRVLGPLLAAAGERPHADHRRIAGGCNGRRCR